MHRLPTLSSLIILLIVVIARPLDAHAAPPLPSLELQGHRGARGLAPENTIPAFHLAYLHGMTTLELDTTLTADGQLIVHHDTMTNAALCVDAHGDPITSRPVLELTAAQLQSLECGLRAHPRFPQQQRQKAHPPRLAQVVSLEEFWGATPLYNLEIKTDRHHTQAHKERAIEALKRELEALSRERPSLDSRVTLQSFDFEVLALAARLLPSVRRSALFEPPLDLSTNPPRVIVDDPNELVSNMISEAKRLKAGVISPYHAVVTEALIRAAHAEGVKVIPWTVNEPSRMSALIKLGVDGLISDYPDRLNETIKQMGRAVECRADFSDSGCETPLPTTSQRSQRTPLVDLSTVAPSIKVELRYAGRDNFMGKPVRGYDARKCLLTRPAAEALARVQAQLQVVELSLKVFDCYRPQRAVDHFVSWARDLKDQTMKPRYYPNVEKSELFSRGYIAERSGHSRGSTVDLTIEGLDMGTEWDFFGVESHTRHPNLPLEVRAHRSLLTSAMSAQGFVNYDQEWWHYTLSPEPLPHLYLDHPIK